MKGHLDEKSSLDQIMMAQNFDLEDINRSGSSSNNEAAIDLMVKSMQNLNVQNS